MDSAPRLDVVIVAYRNETTIQRCVESVNKVAGVGKVIVVDHGDDATATLAARTGASVVGDLTNPGFGAGQNRGVALTGAPFVLLLNPDATVEPAALAQGVTLMVAEPGIGAVQGAIVNPDSGRLDRSQGMELTSLHLWGRVLGARRLSG
ncbi:MAG: glycosyltransferase family 2 protein, partial [Acidimicrobiales bacterium]